MSTRWAMRGVVGVLGWSLAAVGVAEANCLPVGIPGAPEVFPYRPQSSSVILAFKQGGVEVPNWLPEPLVPVQVVVKVNDVVQTSGFSLTLVPPATGVTFDGITNPFLNVATLTTSAYPGRYENADNPAPLLSDAPDFELSGDTLTPTDGGGFAVLDVTFAAMPQPGVAAGLYRFICPQDGDPGYALDDLRNANGIPAIWEQQFCTAAFPCPTGREDTDAPPVSTTHFGDGIPAHGEYRGFQVRGVGERWDPRQKDIVIVQVNPQCNPGGNGPPTDADKLLSVLGGGTQTLLGDDLFDGVTHLFGAAQTHLLHAPGVSNHKSTEWVDHFVKYTLSTGVVLDPPGSSSDRRLNKNAVLLAGPIQNNVLSAVIPKGIRVIECPAGPPGAFGIGNPGFVNDNLAYAIVYPQRVINEVVNNLIPGGGGRLLKHGTYVGGRKTTPVLTGDGTPANSANANIWAQLFLKFVAAQETLHVGDRVNPGGGHTAEQDGFFTDITLYNKVDKSASGFNTTYFPSGPDAVSTGDKANYLLIP